MKQFTTSEITEGLDLLGDWLDAKGYTEEAGLCTKAMDEINRLREEIDLLREFNNTCDIELRYRNERYDECLENSIDMSCEIAELRQAMHEIYEVYAGSEGFKPETCAEAYLQDRIKEMAYIAGKHKRVGGVGD